MYFDVILSFKKNLGFYSWVLLSLWITLMHKTYLDNNIISIGITLNTK